MNLSNRQAGLLLSSISALPFIGGLLYHLNPKGALTGGPDLGVCPVRYYLGIPCALCGASRSFTLLMHHDRAFLSYNPWWVLIFTVALFLGIGMLYPPTANKIRAFIHRQSQLKILMIFFVVVLGGWAVAWINFAQIVPLPS